MKRNSYAKINLDLRVVGKRKDGYHMLDMIVAPIALHDVIEMQLMPTQEDVFYCTNSTLKMDENNLVIKALRRFQEVVEFNEGVSIKLEKNIPIEAGLGGGSSNAATTLLMLNEIKGYPLSDVQLQQIASELGSDVLFFLDPHLAIVRGTGTIIERLECSELHQHPITLIKPSIGCSTTLVYQQVKSFSFPVSQVLKELLSNKQLDVFFASLHNDLFLPAVMAYPMLEHIEAEICDALGEDLVMTGSGSCLVLYRNLSQEEDSMIKSQIQGISAIFYTEILERID